MAKQPCAMEAPEADVGISIPVRWGKKKLTLSFAAEEVSTFSLHDFKRKLERETNVRPKRQKLVGIGAKGLKTNGLSEDEERSVPLKDLLAGLKPGKSVMMIGSVEAVIEGHRKEEELKLALADEVFTSPPPPPRAWTANPLLHANPQPHPPLRLTRRSSTTLISGMARRLS